MFKRLGHHSEEMALALILWLCSLPLVAFIVLPLFGRAAALTVAVALLLVALAVCWGFCTWKVLEVESSVKSLWERHRDHGAS